MAQMAFQARSCVGVPLQFHVLKFQAFDPLNKSISVVIAAADGEFFVRIVVTENGDTVHAYLLPRRCLCRQRTTVTREKSHDRTNLYFSVQVEPILMPRAFKTPGRLTRPRNKYDVARYYSGLDAEARS